MNWVALYIALAHSEPIEDNPANQRACKRSILVGLGFVALFILLIFLLP